MKRMIFMAILLFSGSVNALELNFEPERDIAALLISGDWLQTREIAKDPNDGHREGQIYKIIGVNPSKASVNWFFVAKLSAHYGINRYGKKEHVKIYNWLTIIAVTKALIKNKSLGLSVSF